MAHIVVWFSSGAASAVAAKLTIEKYGAEHQISVVNNPIKEEDPDNLRFLKDVEKWIGQPILTATNPIFPDHSAVAVWEHRGYMGGISGAPCTTHLKRDSRYLWQLINKPDFHVFGFTADEVDRHESFIASEEVEVIPVLIEENFDKDDCFKYLLDAGIYLPAIYYLGYPNANCVGCVKASSPTYWNHVRDKHPEVFDERAEQSHRLGARLVRVKGVRIFLHELDPAAEGEPMESMDIECGIFCNDED